MYLCNLHVSVVMPQDACQFLSEGENGKLWPCWGFGVVRRMCHHLHPVPCRKLGGCWLHLAFAAALKHVSPAIRALLYAKQPKLIKMVLPRSRGQRPGSGGPCDCTASACESAERVPGEA